jgi:transposase
VVGVEQWAEIRRMHFVAGLSIKEIARRTGRDRNTVRRALRSQQPPRYERRPRPSKLDPFREEIHRLLRGDGELPGQVIRERLQELGYAGGRTILDDYLREVGRSSRRRARSSARSIDRARSASSICGSPAAKSRWGRSSTAAPGLWSPAWATRAPARAR